MDNVVLVPVASREDVAMEKSVLIRTAHMDVALLTTNLEEQYAKTHLEIVPVLAQNPAKKVEPAMNNVHKVKNAEQQVSSQAKIPVTMNVHLDFMVFLIAK